MTLAHHLTTAQNQDAMLLTSQPTLAQPTILQRLFMACSWSFHRATGGLVNLPTTSKTMLYMYGSERSLAHGGYGKNYSSLHLDHSLVI